MIKNKSIQYKKANMLPVIISYRSKFERSIHCNWISLLVRMVTILINQQYKGCVIRLGP